MIVKFIVKTFILVLAATVFCDSSIAQTVQSRLSAEDYYTRGLKAKTTRGCPFAMEDFNQAIKLNPKDARLYKERGECLMDVEKVKALADLNQAIKLKPDYAEAFKARGNFYLNEFLTGGNLSRDKEKALQDFNQSLKIDPRCAECYYARAKFYFWARDTGERIFADLDSAIKFAPVNEEYLMWRANLYHLLDEHKKSIADCDALLKINPQNTDALFVRAQNYFFLKDYQKAVDDYTKALELRPITALLFLTHRAKTYRAMGKNAEAEADENRIKVLTGRN